MEKFIAISDLHGYLPELPKCDYVLICGDIVPLEIQRDVEQSTNWFKSAFTDWANSLDCKKVIFIGGNHDFFLQTFKAEVKHPKHISFLKDNDKLVYLRDTYFYTEEVNKIYGTPWCQALKNWAFCLSDTDLNKVFNYIPEDTDILLTHMPSTIGQTGMILDSTLLDSHKELGNQFLANTINSEFSCIKYALCGHIHSGNHEVTELNGHKVVNVSIKDEDYKPTYKPFEFEI